MLKLRHALFLFRAIAWLINRMLTTHRVELHKVNSAISQLRGKRAVLEKEVVEAGKAYAKMKEFIGG